MKFCVVGNAVAQALQGDYIGGAEKQTALIAKALANRGHSVSAVDVLYSGPECEIAGVRVLPAWEVNRGIPLARYLYYRMPTLLRTLREIGADYYYYRGLGHTFLFLPIVKHITKSKVFWGLSSDDNLDRKIRNSRAVMENLPMRDRLMRSLVSLVSQRYADVILCQNNYQFSLAQKLKNIRAFIVPNILECPPDEGNKKHVPDTCVWVGKFCGIKGESKLLALAEQLPWVTFRTIGRVSDSFRVSPLYRALATQQNIEMLGKLAYSDVLSELKKVPLMVHTAPYEGFCNAFLEAWSCKCPVVSLKVDTNGLLSEGGLGACAKGDLARMADHIEHFLKNPSLLASVGQRAYEYVRECHSPDAIADIIETMAHNKHNY